jgi:transcriptional regulator with XRE-family HTH domain
MHICACRNNKSTAKAIKMRLTQIILRPMYDSMSITLRTWRKSRGLTIEAVARDLDISGASLSRIERGEQWPDRAMMIRIVDLTNGDVRADDFLPEFEAAEHKTGGK